MLITPFPSYFSIAVIKASWLRQHIEESVEFGLKILEG